MGMTDDRDEILKKAYEIWQEEGCPSGKELEHWFKAESMLAEQRTKAKPGRKTASKKRAAPKKAASKKAAPKKKAASKKASKAKS